MLHCTNRCSKPKKWHKTCSDAYPRVDLNDMDGLEHLARAVCDGVFLPGNPPTLTGYHDWQQIIVGTMLTHLSGKNTRGALSPCTFVSHNTKWASEEATPL